MKRYVDLLPGLLVDPRNEDLVVDENLHVRHRAREGANEDIPKFLRQQARIDLHALYPNDRFPVMQPTGGYGDIDETPPGCGGEDRDPTSIAFLPACLAVRRPRGPHGRLGQWSSPFEEVGIGTISNSAPIP